MDRKSDVHWRGARGGWAVVVSPGPASALTTLPGAWRREAWAPVPFSSAAARRWLGPLLGPPPRPPELDDGALKDFHQIWAGAGNVLRRAPPETSNPGNRGDWGRSSRQGAASSRRPGGSRCSGGVPPLCASATQFPPPSRLPLALPALTPPVGGEEMEGCGEQRDGTGRHFKSSLSLSP